MVELGGRGLREAGAPPRPRVPTRKIADASRSGIDIHIVVTHCKELITQKWEIAKDDFLVISWSPT
jgi:hypothetical protein